MGKIIGIDENRYKLIGNFVNQDTVREFDVFQVMGIISHDDDHVRRLFRIEESGSDRPFYIGICVSRSNLKVEENRGREIEDIWQKYIENYIEKPLIYEDNVDIQSRELEIGDTTFWKGLNPEDGSYLPEVMKNIRISNLANPYNKI